MVHCLCGEQATAAATHPVLKSHTKNQEPYEFTFNIPPTDPTWISLNHYWQLFNPSQHIWCFECVNFSVLNVCVLVCILQSSISMSTIRTYGLNLEFAPLSFDIWMAKGLRFWLSTFLSVLAAVNCCINILHSEVVARWEFRLSWNQWHFRIFRGRGIHLSTWMRAESNLLRSFTLGFIKQIDTRGQDYNIFQFEGLKEKVWTLRNQPRICRRNKPRTIKKKHVMGELATIVKVDRTGNNFQRLGVLFQMSVMFVTLGSTKWIYTHT